MDVQEELDGVLLSNCTPIYTTTTVAVP